MKDPRKAREPQNEKAESGAKRRRDQQHLDEMLDEALEETFPASDPIALNPESG